MKLKIFASLLLVGASLSAFAQGYKDGIEYFKVDKFDNAKELLNRNLNNSSTVKWEAYYYLGQLALNEGNLAEAKANFEKGAAANPADPYNQIGLATITLKNGDKKGAEEAFKAAVKLAPKKDPKVQVAIARAYYMVDPNLYAKEINKSIETARKNNAKDPDSYIFEGDTKSDNEQWGDAAGQYELAISYDDKAIEAYVKYANTYFHVNPKFAIEKLEELLAKQPQSALAQRELAEKYYEHNLGSKAAEQYGEYIKNPNHFTQDKIRYVQLLFFGERYQESLDLANELLSTIAASDKNQVYMTRMKLYNLVAMEKMPEAVEAGKALFNLHGHGVKFEAKDYTDYAAALRATGDVDGAMKQYELAVEMNPDKVDLMRELAETYTDGENYVKAAKFFQMVVDSPDCKANDIYVLSTAYSNLAATTEDLELKAEAIAKARSNAAIANEKVPNNYRIVQQMARVEEIAGNNLEADKYYDEVIVLLDQKENAREEYANVYKRIYQTRAVRAHNSGDMETAKKNYLLWLQVDPENEGLRKYVETLK